MSKVNVRPLKNSIPNIDEFKNLMDIHAFQLKQSFANEMDMDFRKQLLSEFYKIPITLIDSLIEIPTESRRELCAQMGIERSIFRTLFDYNRYSECYTLYNFLSENVDFKGMKILDFGCLVSDYGFFFGMLGATITFCDFKEQVDFADFRLGKANISRIKRQAPASYTEITKDQDLAIFGEVLEHLEDPYLLLKSCLDNNVKYIYTSCYPYGDDTYFNLPGHTKEAKDQVPQCLDLLKGNCTEVLLVKKSRLWISNQ